MKGCFIMNSDFVLGLSSKIERLQNRLNATEANLKLESNKIRKDITLLKDEVGKTNELLLELLKEIKKK